jgi:DNA-binding NarL/FixJ family response regulator
LFISEKTVSVHLSRVMAKLGAGSRTGAVSVAHERGLLALPTSEPAGTA